MSLARHLQRLAEQTGESYTPGHEPSWWLRSRLVDLHTRGRAGQLDPCPHLRPGTTAFAALWAPDRVVCAGCVPSLRLTGDADRTCDRCGIVSPTGVHPAMTAASPSLLVSLGLCRGCLGKEMGR